MYVIYLRDIYIRVYVRMYVRFLHVRTHVIYIRDKKKNQPNKDDGLSCSLRYDAVKRANSPNRCDSSSGFSTNAG